MARKTDGRDLVVETAWGVYRRPAKRLFRTTKEAEASPVTLLLS